MTPFPQSRPSAAIVLAGDGTIRGLTPAAERLVGYSAAALFGRPVAEILDDRGALEARRMLAEAREHGMWAGEIRLRDGRGSFLCRHGLLTALESDEPEGGYLLLIRGAYGEAEPVPGPIEVSSRLRALAHRMNNPLAVMMGFAQLLLMETPDGDPDRGHVARIYGEMRRLAEAVEELHEYARSLEPVPQSESGRGT